MDSRFQSVEKLSGSPDNEPLMTLAQATQGGNSLPTIPLEKELDPQSVTSHQNVQAFGPSILPEKHARGAVDGLEIPKDRMEARAAIRKSVPTLPGVYGYFDRNGRINYVGKSKSLRSRLLSYFAKNPTDEKMKRIVQHSGYLRFEPVSHELLALIREQELIIRWRPSFNRQGQPERRQPSFLCISDRDAPHVFHTARVSEKSRNGFGPVVGSGRLRETAENLNHVFRLRDCAEQTSIRFNDQLELFPGSYPAGCIRYEIGSCTGPCTGTFPRQDYSQQVEQVQNFLQGFDRSILKNLEADMNRASGQFAFEKAMMLRDQIRNLTWLDQRLEELRRARYDLNCIYPVAGFGRKTIWICLTSSLVSHIVSLPTGRNLARSALEKLNQFNSQSGQVLPHDTSTILMQVIVLRWFRKYPDEKKSLISYAEAISHCQRKMAS